MIFHATELDGVFLIEPERREDPRGYFARTFDRDQMAAHGLAHADAEVATARAAAAAGIAFIPSTMSTKSMEAIAAGAPDATRWFQLYAQADPDRRRSLVERAEAAGYGAIVLTVDLPELGYRERDRRNGFELDVRIAHYRRLDATACAELSG